MDIKKHISEFSFLDEISHYLDHLSVYKKFPLGIVIIYSNNHIKNYRSNDDVMVIPIYYSRNNMILQQNMFNIIINYIFNNNNDLIIYIDSSADVSETRFICKQFDTLIITGGLVEDYELFETLIVYNK